MNSALAPIVLFVYNRPLHTRKTLEALAANDLADKSKLIIFSDGPKQNASEEQVKQIEEVRQIVHSIHWCNEVCIIESDYNKGLADSIINGVTEVVNHYGKVIVLEDDLVLSSGFLKFMNRALTIYENEKKVMHISGYSYPLFRKGKNKIYFLKHVGSWGWATWADRWQCFENDAGLILQKLGNVKVQASDFNSGFGKDFATQLILNVKGLANTWAIKWHSSVYLENGLTLFPKLSLVRNVGFDGGGTHMNILNAVLAGQKMDTENNFMFTKPYFSKVAYRKLQFYYFTNVSLNKKRIKLINKLKKTTSFNQAL